MHERKAKNIIYNLWNLTEQPNLRNIRIDYYLIYDIGLFKFSLSENESQNNEKRKLKITYRRMWN